MINLLFAPGCYGNYIASCLCNYTTLSPHTFDFKLDENGSSHHFREFIQKFSPNIQLCHRLPDEIANMDKIITILPLQAHTLDYIDNQIVKNNYNLHKVFFYLIPDANEKLITGWQYNSIESAPVWVLRELISLNIQPVMKDYGNIEYTDSNATFSTNDIFNNFTRIFIDMSELLELSITQSLRTINKTHNDFVASQTQHNIQIRCSIWVDDILSNRNTKTPCTTIFDEAYVQYRLRDAGHELKCDGLDVFPKTSHKVWKLLYKI